MSKTRKTKSHEIPNSLVCFETQAMVHHYVASASAALGDMPAMSVCPTGLEGSWSGPSYIYFPTYAVTLVLGKPSRFRAQL